MTRAELETRVDNFVNTYLGRTKVGFNIPGQCVALCNQYWLDVWGIRFPLQGAETAYEILSKATNTRADLFEKVTNNPNDLNQLPSKGDVMIWKNLAGGDGHCAIYLSKGSGVFTSLDQNWTANTVTKVTHDWNNVAGWIHNKTTEPVPVDPTIALNAKITNLQKQLDDKTAAYNKLVADKKISDEKVKALDGQITMLTDELNKQANTIKELQSQVKPEKEVVEGWFKRLWISLFNK